MLTYYLVFLAVLVFAGAAQRADSAKTPVVTASKYWGPSFVHNKEVLRYFLIASLVLVCVAGLRFRVGTDFGAYFLDAEDYADKLGERIITLDEPGYSLIASVTRMMGFTDGRGAIFLASAITIGSVLLVFYKFSSQLLLVTLLYFLTFWTACFNGVRQCLAVSMVFLGYGALRDRKFWRYAICVAVAWLFHHSAICMLLPYFFVYSKISWRNFLLIAIGSIVVAESYELLFGFANSVMDKNYILGEGSYMYREVNILRVLAGVAPALYFVLPKLFRGIPATKEETLCINLLIMRGAICVICAHSPCFYRMAMYFSPFCIMALAYLISTTPANSRKPLGVAVCALYAIFFLYEVSKSGSLNSFHFIWDKNYWYPGMG